MDKKTVIWAAVGLLCIVVIIGLWFFPTCERRECYFVNDFLSQDEVYYDEPEDLVDRFFSNPDVYSFGGDGVRISETTEGVTVIIEMYGVPDDSIRDTRYRYDLREVDGYWKVEWSGMQQRCRRDPIESQTWHNRRCP